MSIKAMEILDFKNNNGPSYKNLIQAICNSINNGVIKKGDKLPSLNEIKAKYNLSRDTVITAFNELKQRGIIKAYPGKGYYVAKTSVKEDLRVFLLFDELNAFKEELYNSIITNLKGKAIVDIYFHYFNRKTFENLILNNIGNYGVYVIMPVYFKGISPVLSKITGKVIILDQLCEEVKDIYSAVYQDFEMDVENALLQGINLIKKYKKLIFVYPGGKEPIGQLYGFKNFCEKYKIKGKVINSVQNVEKNFAYIIPDDKELVKIIKLCKQNNYEIGEDVGLISYNDHPLKEVVANGITTISTDFKQMGVTLSKLIFSKKIEQIKNPSSLIIRNSL